MGSICLVLNKYATRKRSTSAPPPFSSSGAKALFAKAIHAPPRSWSPSVS
eukprot:CAMPEP_0198672400 /NCGR_PEP_ID=MMETSP1467-20131203/90996_1 /TAXON_ID=1462469 /ORGANISM="unid. sp., Strain CCMP2135" /LENGTH=49 /DNA_ID=CAMNT_0044409233 /DNA_START=146 /DNA_END=295 /DNA_ORIENTATION=+